MRSQLEENLKKVNGNVHVICLNFDVNVIRTLCSYLEFESEQAFAKSVDVVIER